jgi:hypothetical protein
MNYKMVKWISKINWLKVIQVGVIYSVFAFVIRQIESFLTMKYYLMPEYFGLWSKLMMSNTGSPPMTFFVRSLVFTFGTGISLTLVYYYIHELLPKNFRERVFLFADLLIGLQFIFFTLPVYLLFNIPIGLLVSWFISSFIILVFTSYILVKIIK